MVLIRSLLKRCVGIATAVVAVTLAPVARAGVIDLNPLIHALNSYPSAFTPTGVLIGKHGQANEFDEGMDFVYDHGSAQVIDLGGRTSAVKGFNSRGDLFGNGTNAMRNPTGFVWRNGRLTILGTGGDPASYANAINENGDVVGSVGNPDGTQNATIWASDDLSTPILVNRLDSSGYDIDDKRKVVGWVYPRGETYPVPFVHRDGHNYPTARDVDLSAFDLSWFYPSIYVQLFKYGYIYDIAGFAQDGALITRCYVDLAGAPVQLSLGGTQCRSIYHNENGIVGSATNVDEEPHAFLWRNGEMIDLSALTDVVHTDNGYGRFLTEDGFAVFQTSGSDADGNGIGDFNYVYNSEGVHKLTLGGAYSWVSDVNGKDDVVGYATTVGDTATHAFLRRNGNLIDLNPPNAVNSWAYAINDAGDVAGSYQLSTGEVRAFLYRRGKTVDLGVKAQTSEATLVSEDGQVAGYFIDAKGRKHTFLYTQEG